MLKKLRTSLRDSLTLPYIKGKGKVDELKNDVSGMEIIQVVILVAIGVVLVGALIVLIGPLLAEWWEEITNGAGGPRDLGAP